MAAQQKATTRLQFDATLAATIGHHYTEGQRTTIKNAFCAYRHVPTEDWSLRLEAILERSGVLCNVAEALNSRLSTINIDHLEASDASVFSEAFIAAVDGPSKVLPQVPLICNRATCVGCGNVLPPRAVWPTSWCVRPRGKKKGIRSFSTKDPVLVAASVFSYARPCLNPECELDHFYDFAKGNGKLYVYSDWRDRRFMLGVGQKACYYESSELDLMTRLVLEAQTSFSAAAEAFDAVAAGRPLGSYKATSRTEDIYKRRPLQHAIDKACVLRWEELLHEDDGLQKQNLICLSDLDSFDEYLLRAVDYDSGRYMYFLRWFAAAHRCHDAEGRHCGWACGVDGVFIPRSVCFTWNCPVKPVAGGFCPKCKLKVPSGPDDVHRPVRLQLKTDEACWYRGEVTLFNVATDEEPATWTISVAKETGDKTTPTRSLKLEKADLIKALGRYEAARITEEPDDALGRYEAARITEEPDDGASTGKRKRASGSRGNVASSQQQPDEEKVAPGDGWASAKGSVDVPVIDDFLAAEEDDSGIPVGCRCKDIVKTPNGTTKHLLTGIYSCGCFMNLKESTHRAEGAVVCLEEECDMMAWNDKNEFATPLNEWYDNSCHHIRHVFVVLFNLLRGNDTHNHSPVVTTLELVVLAMIKNRRLDGFHRRVHSETSWCRRVMDPADCPTLAECDTEANEQSNSWLGLKKSLLREMTEGNYKFRLLTLACIYSQRCSQRRLTSERPAPKKREIPVGDLKSGAKTQWNLPDDLRISPPAAFVKASVKVSVIRGGFREWWPLLRPMRHLKKAQASISMYARENCQDWLAWRLEHPTDAFPERKSFVDHSETINDNHKIARSLDMLKPSTSASTYRTSINIERSLTSSGETAMTTINSSRQRSFGNTERADLPSPSSTPMTLATTSSGARSSTCFASRRLTRLTSSTVTSKIFRSAALRYLHEPDAILSIIASHLYLPAPPPLVHIYHTTGFILFRTHRQSPIPMLSLFPRASMIPCEPSPFIGPRVSSDLGWIWIHRDDLEHFVSSQAERRRRDGGAARPTYRYDGSLYLVVGSKRWGRNTKNKRGDRGCRSASTTLAPVDRVPASTVPSRRPTGGAGRCWWTPVGGQAGRRTYRRRGGGASTSLDPDVHAEERSRSCMQKRDRGRRLVKRRRRLRRGRLRWRRRPLVTM